MHFRIRVLDDVIQEFDAFTEDELAREVEKRLHGGPQPGRYLDVKTGRQWMSVHAHAYGLANYHVVGPNYPPGAWLHAERTMAFYEQQVRNNRRVGMRDPEDFVHDFSKGKA